MKIAILLCGHYRTWDVCSASVYSLYNKLKELHHVNMFAAIYKNRYGYHPYIRKTLNFYEEQIMPDDTSIQYCDVISINNSDSVDTSNFHPNMKDLYHGYSQYDIFGKCVKLMEAYEFNNDICYDVVIKLRMDLVINSESICNELMSLKESDILINHGDTTHPSDHIIISYRKNIIDMPSFVKRMYISPSSSLCWTDPPHGLLLSYALCHNLSFITRTISRCQRV